MALDYIICTDPGGYNGLVQHQTSVIEQDCKMWLQKLAITISEVDTADRLK